MLVVITGPRLICLRSLDADERADAPAAIAKLRYAQCYVRPPATHRTAKERSEGNCDEKYGLACDKTSA